MFEFKGYPALSPNGKKRKITIASGVVILSGPSKSQKILLAKHDDPFWKITGGKIHDDESLRAAALRECKEETGLMAKIKGKPFIIIVEKSGKFIILVHYFYTLPKSAATKIKSQRKGVELKWFETAHLPKNIAPNIKLVILHFAALRNKK